PRQALVREAVRHWRAQLIDLGGRNTLLYYRDLKVGTLDLGTADPVALAALLEGRTVALRQLYRDREAHAQALKRARTIRNKARELAEERGSFDPAPLYERLAKEAAGRVRGFTVAPRHVLGTFSYAKLPMVLDLGTAADVLDDHDVIAAIAGDRVAQESLRPTSGAPADVDEPDPAGEYLVLDADSSQQLAVNAVLAGHHAVVKGPPGTGKSQTIANLIATLVAHGRRVLFVAEKRAAITAVTDRLARRGLGHLVMDVHDGTSTRRRIATELRAAFDHASRIALPDL